MSILVIITGSSSSIITHHQNHNHLFNPKNASLFSLHNHISLSLSKPTSPTPPCSSSSPPPSIPSSSSLLISPSNGDDEPIINDLRYYADIASMLVKDGRFEDFRMVVDTVLSSHKNGVLEFGKLLNLELVMVGIFKGLREKRIKSVVGLLGCFPQLGIDVLGLFDDSAMELLKKEYIHIVKSGNLEVGVQLIETLAGFRFPIRELVKSSEMIKICVDKRSPRLALRYVCLLPHAEILVCTVIREFGKKKDIDSALEVFEASKQKMVGNMYVYRTIIDVCGLCGDCSKSRFIYEDLLVQKVTPNIYVFNSLMNVNAHALSYTMEVDKQMQSLGVEADMTSYNILLKACCLSGRVDLAQDIYREVQRLQSSGSLKLDVFTYSTIIKILKSMVESGIRPDFVSYTTAIKVCVESKNLKTAFSLCAKMKRHRIKPNLAFTWTLILGRINTNDMLQRWRPGCCLSPDVCVMCGASEELVAHLFLHCKVAQCLWRKLFGVKGEDVVFPSSVLEFLQVHWVGFGRNKELKLLQRNAILATLWCIWLERNGRVFSQLTFHPVSVWEKVSGAFRSYSINEVQRNWACL